MNRLSLLILFCFILAHGYAQDTLHNPVGNTFYSDLLKQYKKNPVNMARLPLKDFTASTLYYLFEEGDLKQGAEPEAIHDFGLKTEGIFRTKSGLTFFGDLTVKKTYYRDMRWNLSYMMPEKGIMPDPHYFGVSKPGNWNNQHYELNGGIVIPIKNRWNIAFIAGYNLFNKYRVDLDPRPKITYNKLKLGGNLAYNFTTNHSLNFGYAYQFENISNGTSFSNSNQNLPVNYDIYIKWIAGYGSLINVFDDTIKRENNTHSFSLGYTYQKEGDLFITTAYFDTSENITFRQDLDDVLDSEDTYFGTFKPTSLNVQVIGLKTKTEEIQMKATYGFSHKSGDNYLISKAGKTYSSSITEHDFSIAKVKQNSQGNTIYELGAALRYWEASQRDALAVTRSDLKNAEIDLYGQKVIYENQKLRLRPQLKASLLLNIDAQLQNGNSTYLENINEYDYAAFSTRDYYNQVIYPDQQLLATDRFKLELGSYIDFMGSSNKNILLNIKAGYLTPLKNTAFFEKSNRLYTAVSLILNY